MATGELIGMGLGLAILVFPVLGAWILWREMRFGYTMQRVATSWRELGIDPADLTYERSLAAVEATPLRWEPWFELGLAYDRAGDRRRARAAMRESAARFTE